MRGTPWRSPSSRRWRRRRSCPVPCSRKSTRCWPSRRSSRLATEQVSAAVGSLGKLLLMEPDRDTPCAGRCVRAKRVVVAAAARGRSQAHRPGHRVDHQRRPGGVRDGCVPSLPARAGRGAGPTADRPGGRPVNLRPIEQAAQLGNRFGLVFLTLPLGVEDSLDPAVRGPQEMGVLKKSANAYVAFQILRAIGAAPKQISTSR